MNIGAIIFYIYMDSWTSKIQQYWWKLFKRGGWMISHTSVYSGKYLELGRRMEVEANLQVDHTTFHPDIRKRLTYNLMGVNRLDVVKILNQTIDQSEEKLYGFIGWLAIAIRTILETILPKSVRPRVKKWNILWGWGIFCSEFVYMFLYELAKHVSRYYTHAPTVTHWQTLLRRLNEYNPNTFTPLDLIAIVDEFEGQCFEGIDVV